MGKIRHNLIINPKWFIFDEDEKMYDVERQGYMVQRNERDISKYIDERNYDSFVELLYHGLNINSLIDNKLYYDEYHILIVDPKLSQLYKYMTNDNDKNRSFSITVDHFKHLISDKMRILSQFIQDDMQKLNVFIKNKNIHEQNEIFYICDTKKSISIFRNKYTSSAPLGNYFEKITEIKGDNLIDQYKLFVDEYNSNIDNKNKITELNSIGIDFRAKISQIRAIKLVRALIITNKWFNGGKTFKFDLIQTLFNPSDNSVFNFKFN